MSEIKKIVIATDGSEYTKKSVEVAVDLAQKLGAEVYGIYVMDTAAFVSVPLDAALEDILDVLREEGKRALKYVEDLAKERGVKVHTEILEGYPAEMIVKYAEEINADLISVGTLGKSGIERFILGSTSEKVIRLSKMPVMVVKGEKRD
jgi:nucleotide-binding universal stress UspA family protein